MSEQEWDGVLNVVLKGSFAPARFAAAYWREQYKRTDERVDAAIVNTTSESGLYGNSGQANYAAAKAGLVALSTVFARDLERIGARANTVAPVAATRLLGTVIQHDAPEEGQYDPMSPAAIAPLVVWLCSGPRPRRQRPGLRQRVEDPTHPRVSSDHPARRRRPGMVGRPDREGPERAPRRDEYRHPAVPASRPVSHVSLGAGRLAEPVPSSGPKWEFQCLSCRALLRRLVGRVGGSDSNVMLFWTLRAGGDIGLGTISAYDRTAAGIPLHGHP